MGEKRNQPTRKAHIISSHFGNDFNRRLPTTQTFDPDNTYSRNCSALSKIRFQTASNIQYLCCSLYEPIDCFVLAYCCFGKILDIWLCLMDCCLATKLHCFYSAFSCRWICISLISSECVCLRMVGYLDTSRYHSTRWDQL